MTSCLNVGWGPHKLAEFGDVVNNLAGILLFVGVCVCVSCGLRSGLHSCQGQGDHSSNINNSKRGQLMKRRKLNMQHTSIDQKQ